MNKPLLRASSVRFLMIFLMLSVVLFFSACAYRHYLGIHGPSIKNFPQVHAGFTADKTCLMCHEPESSATSPKTGHPNFKGCLKCHNDDLNSNH